jgi:hypothetical protein
MAFQSGTAVDPRLMQADYSGFTNAAQMEGDRKRKFTDTLSDAIGAYEADKKQDKEFGQIVKSSLAMTDAMMQNLPPEQAEKLARFATDSGVNDLSLPIEQRAQAAQQFGVSLGAIMESIGDDKITFETSPDGSVVATLVDGQVKDVTRTGSTTMNFGGNPTVDPVDSEEARRAARILELEAKQ